MKIALARALALASLALGVYVVYAHVASWRTTSEYLEQPIAIRFRGASWASGLSVDTIGALRAGAEGERLHVTGTTSADGDAVARLTVRGPARRLREVEVRMRFRARDASDYDLVVGVERADANDDSRARVAFGLANGGTLPRYRLIGDERAEQPRAGNRFGMQRFVPFLRDDADHEVALRISPDLHAVLASVDGAPVSSHLAGWDDGVLVRPFFELRGRTAGQPVDAEIVSVDYLPLPSDTRARAVSERFDGKLLDPRTWRVLHADGWQTDGELALVPGAGLRLTGRAKRLVGEAPVLGLVGPTMQLGSFHATMRVDIAKLHHARLYFGVANLLFGLSDWRAFEAGIVDGVTQTEPFVAGQWEGDGQFRVASLPGVAAEAIATGASREIVIDYDAASGIVTAALDGRALTTQRLDFQPPEEVHLQLGARVIGADGAFDVTLREIRVEPRAWSAGDLAAHARPAPSLDAGATFFTDDFATDSLPAYHLLAGVAGWREADKNVQLGPDAPVGVAEHALVRGFFDAPVTVTGSVVVAGDPVRGSDDSVGLLATDRDAATRYLAVLWYGKALAPALHITRQDAHGVAFLAAAPVQLEPGKSYWVKLRVDRRNVYARAWPNAVGAKEPDAWMVTAPIEEGWTATGGVGFAARATKTWATALRAEP